MLSRRKLRVYILVFLAPAVLIYTAFMIYPLLDSLWLSVNKKAPGVVQSFVGFQNYFTLLMREQWSKPFWNSFKNNILFFVIHMAVQNPIGLFLAALLNMRISPHTASSVLTAVTGTGDALIIVGRVRGVQSSLRGGTNRADDP